LFSKFLNFCIPKFLFQVCSIDKIAAIVIILFDLAYNRDEFCVTSEELFYFGSFASKHGRDLFVSEFTVDLEVRFAVGADFFYLLYLHIFQEK